MYSLTEGIGFTLLLPTLQIAGLNLMGQGDAGRYVARVSALFVASGLQPSLILLLGIFVILGLVLMSGGLLAFAFRGRSRTIEKTGEEVSASTKSLYAATTEHLQTLKAAKTYGAESRNFSIFSDLSAGVARANVHGLRQQAIAGALFELGSVVILAAVLFLSIRMLAVPSASIMILLLVFARVIPRIMTGQSSTMRSSNRYRRLRTCSTLRLDVQRPRSL